MIEGVKLIPLSIHEDDRGYLIEILRADAPHFKQFGQVYISTCYPGVVKAWHAHRFQTDNFFVVKGAVKVGLFDDRDGSSTAGQSQAVILSERNPQLLIIPPLVWHGQMALGGEMSYLLNIPTHTYNYTAPDELRRAFDDPEINFSWEVKNK